MLMMCKSVTKLMCTCRFAVLMRLTFGQLVIYDLRGNADPKLEVEAEF